MTRLKLKTRACELLCIRYPVIQAPMVWITCAELVSAVSEAGGMGTLGPNCGAAEPSLDPAMVKKRLREEVLRTRSLTGKPFAVNVAIGHGPDAVFSDAFADVICEEKVPVAIVSQGSPDVHTRRLKDCGATVLHVVATVAQARKAEAAGVDAIVTSGYEGGGHSGFDGLATFTLVPQVVDAVKIPVICGGGIGDARGLVAALALGADGAYIGTRFMATHECLAHPRVKQALVNAMDTGTVSMVHGARQSFSAAKLEDAAWHGAEGLPGTLKLGLRRLLRNRYALQCLALLDRGAPPSEVQTFMNSLAPGERRMHRAMAGLLRGDLVNGAIPCGQAVGLVRKVTSARDVVRELVAESETIIRRLSAPP